MFALAGTALAAPAAAAALPPDIDAALLAQYGLTPAALMQISDGNSDGLWHPYDEVTRAQYTKFVVKAFGLTPVTPDTPTFSDVPATHPLYGYVEAAAAAGIAKGRTDGFFAPDESITRSEAAAILVRYLVVKNGRNLDSVMPEEAVVTQLGFFADGDQVSAALRKEVALAVARTALKGATSGGSFLLRPNAPLLRIQAAALATRQEKPGLSTLAEGDKQLQGLWMDAFSFLAKALGEGIVHGSVTFGLDKASDALFGNTQWDQVSDELKGIQDTLNTVVQGISDIKNQLSGLADEYTVQSDQIKAMLAGQPAQGAMNTLDSWYGEVGVDNYQYFIGLYADQPKDATATQTAQTNLVAFEKELLDLASGVMQALLDINTSVLPTGAPQSGVLSQWINMVCVGALSDTEIQDAYRSVEYYFCQLISHQMEAAQLLCDANNQQDGGQPAAGKANGPHASDFLTATWFPMLQAECDNYFQNVTRMVLGNAKNVNSFTPDLLGDDNLNDVLARANFICCALEEQITVYGTGAGQGNPQDAYGLQAVLIYPSGLGFTSGGLWAMAGANTYESSTQETTYSIPSGPKTLLFERARVDHRTPATLDVASGYTVRRLSFGSRPSQQPGATFTFQDWASGPGAGNCSHGSVVLQYVDSQYKPVSGPDDNVSLYGCKVISYQYYSADPNDATWYRPRPLGGKGTWTATNATDPEYHDNSGAALSVNGDGKMTVAWSAQDLDMASQREDYYQYEMDLPGFTFIGPNNTQLNFQFLAASSDQTLVDGTMTTPNTHGTGLWWVDLGVQDSSGKMVADSKLSKTVLGQSDVLSWNLANNQTYSFSVSQKASYKAGGWNFYSWNSLTSAQVDHMSLALK